MRGFMEKVWSCILPTKYELIWDMILEISEARTVNIRHRSWSRGTGEKDMTSYFSLIFFFLVKFVK